MTLPATEDDAQLRAMVGLIEAQAQQIAALREAVDNLEGRLALRSELDVLVAHEVRTPLTIVVGCLQTIRAVPVGDPRYDTLLDRATTQAEHLTDVVNELLTPQGSGGPVVNRARLQPVALRDLADKAIDAVSRKLDPSRIEVRIPDELVTMTSPVRVVSILVNLLENGARYGGDGPILLEGSMVDGLLRVDVADRGIGLGAVDPDTLFQPFTQGERRHRDGRGVGLYLVRMLAGTLGGTAALLPRAGGGTIARIELPQRRYEDRSVGSSLDKKSR